MKKFLISLLLCSGSMTIVAGGNQDLIQATKDNDLETIKNIFSSENKPEVRIIDTALRIAFETNKSNEIVSLLLKHNPSKSSTLLWACTNGEAIAVNILLESDKDSTCQNSIANYWHIRNAEDNNHEDIAKTIQAHLVTKGYVYTYPETIQLNQ
jgi:hypothetical protein